MQTKRCFRCREYKTLAAFSKSRAERDGLSRECKTCAAARRPVATKKRALLIERAARTEKPCSKCGTVKPLSDFPKRPTAADGRMPRCAECEASYRAANSERITQQQQQYRAANKEAIQRRERRALLMQDAAECERRAAYQLEWQRQNRQAATAHRNNYEAKKRGNGGTHTAAEWATLCEHYGNLCLCCGQSKPLTADHIVPVSKGGGSSIENIQPLCKGCNSSKQAKTVDFRPDKSCVLVAAAKRAGLDCKAAEAMTQALSKYLGVVIPSRANLSAGQWAEAVAAVELGLLAW